MNKTTNNKRTYNTPVIEYVVIDSEISLQLASNPPYPINENPGSGYINLQDTDPYKIA